MLEILLRIGQWQKLSRNNTYLYLPISTYLHQLPMSTYLPTYLPTSTHLLTYVYIPTHVNLLSYTYLPLPTLNINIESRRPRSRYRSWLVKYLLKNADMIKYDLCDFLLSNPGNNNDWMLYRISEHQAVVDDEKSFKAHASFPEVSRPFGASSTSRPHLELVRMTFWFYIVHFDLTNNNNGH